VRSHLVIVPALSLAFADRVVAADEPFLVQAFRPELAVERFDERVVGQLARPAEVEDHAGRVGLQVEIAGDERAALWEGEALTGQPTVAAMKGDLTVGRARIEGTAFFSRC
jgi:hypothetical protein